MRFGGLYCIYIYETLVLVYQTTRHYIPNGTKLHIYRREKLRYHLIWLQGVWRTLRTVWTRRREVIGWGLDKPVQDLITGWGTVVFTLADSVLGYLTTLLQLNFYVSSNVRRIRMDYSRNCEKNFVCFLFITMLVFDTTTWLELYYLYLGKSIKL
jgi:hypothetical protein